MIGILVALQAGVYQNMNERQFYEFNGHGFNESAADVVTSLNGTRVGVTRYNYSDTDYRVVYRGWCYENDIVLSATFRWWFQKLYTLLYLLCLIVVGVLYSLIYRSVLARRARRRKQQVKQLPLVATNNTHYLQPPDVDNLQLTSNGTTTSSSQSAADRGQPYVELVRWLQSACCWRQLAAAV